jgi:uncharacterized protein (TIGR02444 family)
MAKNHPFWIFSIKTYGSTNVAPACLALQNSCGVNVNILLFCCWAGSQGMTLSSAQIEQGLKIVDSWNRDIVQGLRAVRQRLKGGFESVPKEQTEPLLQKIISIELDAEKTEQHLLADSVSLNAGPSIASDDCLSAAALNIAAYFKQGHLESMPDRNQHLVTVLSACFPAHTPDYVLGSVSKAF